MEINYTKSVDGVLTVMPHGRIDMMSAPEFDVRTKEVLTEDVKQVILDFSDVDYLSSLGLRVLLELQKSISQRGTMKICNVNESIMEILELTGFVNILTIENA